METAECLLPQNHLHRRYFRLNSGALTRLPPPPRPRCGIPRRWSPSLLHTFTSRFADVDVITVTLPSRWSEMMQNHI